MNPLSVNTTGLQTGANYTPPAESAQPVAKPNFFERILPTAGGILGGIAGSALLPFGGTIAGAGAGGALGQEIENKLTGQNQSTKSAGIENAAGMALGGVLGKGFSALAGKVFAPLAEKGATQLVAGQAKGQIDKNVAQYLTDHSFTDLNKAGQMADMLTGSAAKPEGAVLNKFVEDTLANNGPEKVDITDLTMPKISAKNPRLGEITAEANGNQLQKAITNNSLSDTPQAQAIRSKVNAMTNSLPQDINGTTDSLNALNFQRQLASEASRNYQDYIDSGRQNSTALNMYKTYNDLSGAVKSKLGMDRIPVSEDDKNALADDVLNYGQSINPKAAQKLSDTIRSSKDLNLADVRGLEQNWVTVNQALQKVADTANKNFGTSTSDLARSTLPLAGAITGMGGKKSLLGTIGGVATASPSADAKVASVLNTAAQGSKGKLIQQILPRLIQAGTVASFNLPNEETQPQTNPQVSSNITSGAPTMNPIDNPISQLYQTLLAQEQQAPAALASSLVPVLNTLAPQIQKQQLAVPAVENALATFGNAGGAQGLGGGLLSRLTGLIPGTPANTYNAQSVAAAAQLAAALGITPEQAQALLPQLTQTQATATPQIGGIQSILGSLGASRPSAVPAL